jgi:hypothetical protein
VGAAAEIFVEAVEAVDDHGAPGAEPEEDCGDFFGGGGVVDADELAGGAGGVCEGPRRLKTVRKPSSRRDMATWRMAGWV